MVYAEKTHEKPAEALPIEGELSYHRLMKRIYRPHYLFLGCALALTAFGTGTPAQTKTVIKETTAHPSATWDADRLFKEFCAVCHGADGRGGGPAAAALKTGPGDLTQITRRSEGKFPYLKMRSIINGDERIVAHGTSEMPVWGDVFKSISSNQTFGQMRVEALVKYLQSIQR